MAAYPCSDDPSEIIENIVGAGEDAEKFSKFVNGGVSEDVQLGAGQPTPTIRKTVRLMKSASAEIDGSDVSGKFSTASGDTASRMLDERFGDVLNIRDFGAVGDGATDDTAAFEAAGASGKQIFVPEGEYVLSYPVKHGNFVMGPNVSFPSSGLLYRESGSIYRKSIVKELPFKFSGYDVAKSAIAAANQEAVSYIYPQGIAFDEDSNLYVSYCWSPSTSAVQRAKVAIVKYDDKFVYKGYVLVNYGLENVVVIDDASAGKKYLYHRISYQNKLARYDITNASWNGETLAVDSVVLSDVGSNYWHDGNSWYILSQFPDLAQSASRTFIKVYDESFSFISSFAIPKSISGWMTPSSAYYSYIPKMQGFTVRNGLIYVAHGGNAYYPRREGTGHVGDIGCSVVAPDGSILKYGVLDCTKFAARLAAEGRTVGRTEAEAPCVHPNGGVYGIYVTLGPSDAGADGGGVLIVREFAEDGEDYGECASSYSPVDFARYRDGLWPRIGKYDNATGTTVGVLLNPVTGEEITTVEQILDFMVETDVQKASFYSSSTPLTNSMSLDIPSGVLVELKNCNNYTVQMALSGAYESRGARFFSATKTDGTWSAFPVYPKSTMFVLDSGEAETWARLEAKCYDGTDEYVNVLSTFPNAAGTMTMYIGGGSQVRRCASWISFFTTATSSASDVAAPVGKNVMLINGASVRPGTSNQDVSLGTGSYPWKDLYVASGSISTSDSREKTALQEPPEALMRAWGRVRFKTFQFIRAVQEKGASTARIHVGVVAQDIKDAFEAEGLDASRYGLFCHDEWDAEAETLDADGSVVHPAVEAGDRYSVRYEEALALECAYQRWRLEQIEARLNEIFGNGTAPSGASSNNL